MFLQYPELGRHHLVFERMGIEAISSDETDSEHEAVTLTKSHKTKPLKRVSPAWRSREVTLFQWHLDDLVWNARMASAGGKTAPGRPPAFRRHSQSKNLSTPAPSYLPHNCYDPHWLKGLSETRRRQLRMEEAAYDFNVSHDQSHLQTY